MNALQTAYAVAEANLTAIRAEVTRRAPMPITDDETVFEAWIDASEAVETELGLFAAERALSAAEDAMVGWAIKKIAPKAKGEAAEAVAFIASRWPKIGLNHRRKMVDLAFRYDGV